MTREEIIKSALKFLVLKQKEQGSWGYSDRNDNEISWDKVLEWLEKQPCGDLISREDAKNVLANLGISIEDYWEDAIDGLPPVEPERNTGKWLLTIEDWNRWTCSECGFSKRTDIHVSLGYKFCPNCGAKMEVDA